MKLTWFGGTTLRIYIGGSILVSDPVGISRVAPEELIAGADVTFAVGDAAPEVDLARWQPRRPAALLDEVAPAEVLIHRAGEGVVLVEAVGEPPLLLVTGKVPPAGRWSRDAVVVAFGRNVAEAALEQLGPRLIALATGEAELDAAFVALRDRLDGTALVALEPALALEV